MAPNLEKNLYMQETNNKYDSIIIGLGKTGLSCVNYLSRLGQSFAVIDSRNDPPDLNNLKQFYPDVPFHLGQFDPNLLCTAKSLIVSPGVSIFEPAIQYAVQHGVELIGDIELFVKEAQAPIIAVTGSNGKSTVATLITEMIKEAGQKVELGGNIGKPALSLLNKSHPDFYVLELSSFQLELVNSLDAVVSVVLNISVDHMDRYKDMNEYIGAKKKIYMGSGCMVINYDDKCVSRMINHDRKFIGYLLNNPKHGDFGIRVIDGSEWLCYGKEPIISASELCIKGRHNISNALAALALGKSIGLQTDPMASVLKNFNGLPHRCEWIATINNIDWINDSKGTNPGASSAAIEGLCDGNNLVLIAGGDGKGADFTSLAKSASGRVHTAILLGRDAYRIAAALTDNIKIYHATSIEGAVSLAAQLASEGDKVLMSPACASLDMYTDYQQRGRLFREAITRLKEGDKSDG